jgi:hypothetical protein
MRLGGLWLLGSALRNVLLGLQVESLELHVTDACTVTAVPAVRSSSSSRSASKVDPQTALRRVANKLCELLNGDYDSGAGYCTLEFAAEAVKQPAASKAPSVP